MKTFQSALVVVTALVLTACSGSGGGGPELTLRGGGGSAPKPQDFKDLVNGPRLDGKWESDCAAIGGGRYAKLTYEFKQRQAKRSENIFDSSSCQRVVDFIVQSGSYRFSNKYGGDVFEVEFNLASAEGFKKIKENFQMSGADLFVSFRAAGSGIAPNIKLIQTEAPADDEQGQTPPPAAPGFAPRVGQKISYAITGASERITLSFEIVSAESTQGPWRLKKITQFHSQGYSQAVTEPTNSMTSAKEMSELLANCEQDGDKKEVIRVAAGEFETCRIEEEGATIWLGLVPIYGMVKRVDQDGTVYELTQMKL